MAARIKLPKRCRTVDRHVPRKLLPANPELRNEGYANVRSTSRTLTKLGQTVEIVLLRDRAKCGNFRSWGQARSKAAHIEPNSDQSWAEFDPIYAELGKLCPELGQVRRILGQCRLMYGKVRTMSAKRCRVTTKSKPVSAEFYQLVMSASIQGPVLQRITCYPRGVAQI